MAFGLGTIVVVVAVQVNTPEAIGRVEGSTDHDIDQMVDEVRQLELLDGQLKLTLDREPMLGSQSAKHVVAMMFDYACLHCRHTHNLLVALRNEQYGQKLSIVGLPVPLNRKCNLHEPSEMPKRFDHSCELARIVLAVFLADPLKFVEFDQWIFQPRKPRQVEEAKAHARELVGPKSPSRHLPIHVSTKSSGATSWRTSKGDLIGCPCSFAPMPSPSKAGLRTHR